MSSRLLSVLYMLTFCFVLCRWCCRRAGDIGWTPASQTTPTTSPHLPNHNTTNNTTNITPISPAIHRNVTIWDRRIVLIIPIVIIPTLIRRRLPRKCPTSRHNTATTPRCPKPHNTFTITIPTSPAITIILVVADINTGVRRLQAKVMTTA